MDIVQLSMFDGKVCPRCKQEKPRTEFHRSKNRKDGLHPWCKVCTNGNHSVSKKQWLSSTREKQRQYHEHYLLKIRAQAVCAVSKPCLGCGKVKPKTDFHKNKSLPDGFQKYCKDCRKARYDENSDTLRAKKKNQYWADPERMRAEKRRDHQKHRATRNQKRLVWRAAHLERERERTRQWGEKYPDRVRSKQKISAHKRRARKRSQGGSFTSAQWDALLQWFGGQCLACGSTEHIQADHVRPLSRGGSNELSNLQPLCRDCNKKKFTKHVDYRDPDRLAAFLEHIQCPSFKHIEASQTSQPDTF